MRISSAIALDSRSALIWSTDWGSMRRQPRQLTRLYFLGKTLVAKRLDIGNGHMEAGDVISPLPGWVTFIDNDGRVTLIQKSPFQLHRLTYGKLLVASPDAAVVWKADEDEKTHTIQAFSLRRPGGVAKLILKNSRYLLPEIQYEFQAGQALQNDGDVAFKDVATWFDKNFQLQTSPALTIQLRADNGLVKSGAATCKGL